MLVFLMTYFLSLVILLGPVQSLVDGSLRMRYCSVNFSHKKLPWRLPHSGGVAALVDTASFRPTVVGLRGSGNILSIRESIGFSATRTQAYVFGALFSGIHAECGGVPLLRRMTLLSTSASDMVVDLQG